MCIPLGTAAWMIMVTIIPNYCNISVHSGSGKLFLRLESTKVLYMEQRLCSRPLDR